MHACVYSCTHILIDSFEICIDAFTWFNICIALFDRATHSGLQTQRVTACVMDHDHGHVHVYRDTHILGHTHIHRYRHTQMHTYTHTQIHAHTHMDTYIQPHTYAHRRTHTYTHAPIHTYRHMRRCVIVCNMCQMCVSVALVTEAKPAWCRIVTHACHTCNLTEHGSNMKSRKCVVCLSQRLC